MKQPVSLLTTRLLLLVTTLWLLVATPSTTTAEASTVQETPPLTKRPCTSRWSLLSRQQNHLPATAGSIRVRLGYTRGPFDVTDDSDVPDDDVIVGLTVRLLAGKTAVELTAAELARSAERSLEVSVPPGGEVSVWQLVAAVPSDDGGSVTTRYGLDSTAVTSGGQAPSGGGTASSDRCVATFRRRRAVREDSWVRLRHAASGRYLVMRPKRNWEAAALGDSREFRFRLVGVGIGDGSVRIEAERYTYGGYKFAYSSRIGNVYFNVLQEGSGSQLWRLSNPYPRDGDAVTIRNVHWPSSALTGVNKGSDVGCITTQQPDRWIIEMAD